MTEGLRSILSALDYHLINFMVKPFGLSGAMGDNLHDLFAFADRILTDVAKPIAYTILALFFILEIYRVSVRSELSGGGTNQLGAEVVFKVFFRLIIFKVVIDQTPEIMRAIYNLSAYLTEKISLVAFSAAHPPHILDVDAIINSMGGGVIMSFGAILVAIIMAIPVYLVVMCAGFVGLIISYLRLIEIYIYYALSPIPLATLPSEEMSSVGKSFLRSFTAVCLQGSIIFLMINFIPVIAGSVLTAVSFGAGLPITTMQQLSIAYSIIICWSIILIMSFFKAQRFASTICQAA